MSNKIARLIAARVGRVRRSSSRRAVVTAALTASLLGGAFFTATSVAASSVVHLKPIPLKTTSHVKTVLTRDVDGEIYLVSGESATERGNRYPVGNALRRALLKEDPRARGKIKLGHVPTPTHAKSGDYYVGGTTPKHFRVKMFVHVGHHVLMNGYTFAANGIGERFLTTNRWINQEAKYELGDNRIVKAVQKLAPRNGGHYPASKTVAAYVEKHRKTLMPGQPDAKAGTPPKPITEPNLLEAYSFTWVKTTYAKLTINNYIGTYKGREVDLIGTATVKGKVKFTLVAGNPAGSSGADAARS